jgi:RNA polymerase sigma-70 factor (ECF subfamily)
MNMAISFTDLPCRELKILLLPKIWCRRHFWPPCGHSKTSIETLTDLADSDFNDHGEWQIRPFKWAINPDKIYEQKEFLNVLYRCLAELPERLAEAFMLREMDGLSTEEICKVLEITATNSWVMLYRARMSLRHCIENKWLSAGK